jgi:PPOX class probable F420-dependent enzyme
MLNDATRAFLDRKYFAVLATINADGSPQQTVMWYEVLDDHVLMNTEASRLKTANIERDSRISICVEDEYSYVTLAGRAELGFDPERAQADIARLARRYQTPEKAEQLIANFQREKRVSIRMSIEQVISKF